MTTLTVHFDRELRRLDPDDAEAWRVWLRRHQLNGFDIACPSVLMYREPTKRKPAATVTVELLTRDPWATAWSTRGCASALRQSQPCLNPICSCW
jgi:hypothetical protein